MLAELVGLVVSAVYGDGDTREGDGREAFKHGLRCSTPVKNIQQFPGSRACFTTYTVPETLMVVPKLPVQRIYDIMQAQTAELCCRGTHGLNVAYFLH